MVYECKDVVVTREGREIVTTGEVGAGDIALVSFVPFRRRTPANTYTAPYLELVDIIILVKKDPGMDCGRDISVQPKIEPEEDV